MRTPPVISAVVPVYNARRFFAQCLNSIAAQEGMEWEAVLVDDGSTDGSGDLCAEFAARDPRFRLFRQDNAGAAAARNRGLAEARGEFVTFVDADDFLEPDAFSALSGCQRETGADLVRGRWRTVREDGNAATHLGGIDQVLFPEREPAYVETAGPAPRVAFPSGPWAYLLRLDIVRGAGIRFREDLCFGEDNCFMLDAIPHARRYAFLDRDVYNYRRNTATSVTAAYYPGKSARFPEHFVWMDRLREYLLSRQDGALVDAALGDLYVNTLIRQLVLCAADSIMGDRREAEGRFRSCCESPLWERYLPHYHAGSAKGKSRLLPWLVRMGLIRTAFHLCRSKARKRYTAEIAAWRKEGER